MEIIRSDAARAERDSAPLLLNLLHHPHHPPPSPSSSSSLSGPGPGRYALPPTVGYVNHDFTKPSSPAYSFHSRMSSASEEDPVYCFMCLEWVDLFSMVSNGVVRSLQWSQWTPAPDQGTTLTPR